MKMLSTVLGTKKLVDIGFCLYPNMVKGSGNKSITHYGLGTWKGAIYGVGQRLHGSALVHCLTTDSRSWSALSFHRRENRDKRPRPGFHHCIAKTLKLVPRALPPMI